LRLLVDAQLPPALARRLSDKGHQAEHLTEIGLGGATDEEIWRHARETGAAIVTKDEDFAMLVRRDPSGPPVVWVRLGNVTNRALWQALEPLLPEVVEALGEGERLIEIV
jgi:predicted nuclease of predicted toxin-antitoxin system